MAQNKQFGGEGKEKIKVSNEKPSLLKPSPEYCGPGRYLKTEGSDKTSVGRYKMSL